MTLIPSEFLLVKVHHCIIFLESNGSAVNSITVCLYFPTFKPGSKREGGNQRNKLHRSTNSTILIKAQSPSICNPLPGKPRVLHSTEIEFLRERNWIWKQECSNYFYFYITQLPTQEISMTKPPNYETGYQMGLTSYLRKLKSHFCAVSVILAWIQAGHRWVMLSTPGLEQLILKVWARGRSLSSVYLHIYWLERGSWMRGQVPLPPTLHTLE